jgi:hypothetical protein
LSSSFWSHHHHQFHLHPFEEVWGCSQLSSTRLSPRKLAIVMSNLPREVAWLDRWTWSISQCLHQQSTLLVVEWKECVVAVLESHVVIVLVRSANIHRISFWILLYLQRRNFIDRILFPPVLGSLKRVDFMLNKVQ